MARVGERGAGLGMAHAGRIDSFGYSNPSTGLKPRAIFVPSLPSSRHNQRRVAQQVEGGDDVFLVVVA